MHFREKTNEKSLAKYVNIRFNPVVPYLQFVPLRCPRRHAFLHGLHNSLQLSNAQTFLHQLALQCLMLCAGGLLSSGELGVGPLMLQLRRGRLGVGPLRRFLRLGCRQFFTKSFQFLLKVENLLLLSLSHLGKPVKMGLLKPIIRIRIESGISRVWIWIRIQEGQEKRKKFMFLRDACFPWKTGRFSLNMKVFHGEVNSIF
jgi:hypothetical protein